MAPDVTPMGPRSGADGTEPGRFGESSQATATGFFAELSSRLATGADVVLDS